MKTIYTAHVTTVAGREGYTETDDKRLSHDLSPPGGNGKGTNPEQLFAAGYSACFGSAIAAIAKKQNTAVSEIKVQADISLNEGDDKGYFLSAILTVSLAGVDKATAQKLMEAAHQICPYSKATRGNIDVQLKLNEEAASKAA